MKPMSQYLSSKNLYGVFLHLVVIVLVVEVIILGYQNREFKRMQNRSQQVSVKPGDSLTFAGISALDPKRPFDTCSQRRAVFVFTTKCPFCKETFPLWNRIVVGDTGLRRFDYVGICLDSERETKLFIAEQKPTFPVFVPAERESYVKMNRLYGVPQTILVSGTGRVEKVWKGRLNEDDLRELSGTILDRTTIQHQRTNHKGDRP